MDKTCDLITEVKISLIGIGQPTEADINKESINPDKNL